MNQAKRIKSMFGKILSRGSESQSYLPSFIDSGNRLFVHTVQICIFVGSWYALASVFPNNLMPYPIATLEILFELTIAGEIWRHFFLTFQRIVISVSIAMGIGVIAGIPMGISPYWKHTNLPYLIFLMTTPSIIWALAAIIFFGYGNTGVIFVGVIATVPWTTLEVWKGTENIQTDLITMASSFDLSIKRLLSRLIIPDIAPSLFGAARLGVGLAFKAIIVAEFIVTKEGIGARVLTTYEAYQYQEAWAWSIVILGIILTIEIGLRRLENRVFRYRD